MGYFGGVNLHYLGVGGILIWFGLFGVLFGGSFALVLCACVVVVPFVCVLCVLCFLLVVGVCLLSCFGVVVCLCVCDLSLVVEVDVLSMGVLVSLDCVVWVGLVLWFWLWGSEEMQRGSGLKNARKTRWHCAQSLMDRCFGSFVEGFLLYVDAFVLFV